MAEPISFRRIRCAVMAVGRLGQASSPNDILRLLKRDVDFKEHFQVTNRLTGRAIFISDEAMTGWLRHARYWDLISGELVELTDEGTEIYTGNFNNRFFAHLGKFISRWKSGDGTITIDEMLRVLATLDGRNRGNWPTLDNWYTSVSQMPDVEIPQSRFKQLAYFLVGIGVLRRNVYTLYSKQG